MPSQAFDVWIAETEQVYKGVSFSTLGDWVQEGRVLADDKVREAGSKIWTRVADTPLLSAYLPKAEPFRAEDEAEANEPVQGEISWRHAGDAEDEEVDMIPMIDISLVLLIFFMMTAGTLLVASNIETPPAEHGKVVEAGGDTLKVGLVMKDGQYQYYLGDDAAPMTLNQLFDEATKNVRAGARVAIFRGAKNVPIEKVQELTIGLEKRGIKRILPSISDKPSEEAP